MSEDQHIARFQPPPLVLHLHYPLPTPTPTPHPPLQWRTAVFGLSNRPQRHRQAATTNKSRQLVGVFLYLRYGDDGLCNHQRVTATRWCVFLYIIRPTQLSTTTRLHHHPQTNYIRPNPLPTPLLSVLWFDTHIPRSSYLFQVTPIKKLCYHYFIAVVVNASIFTHLALLCWLLGLSGFLPHIIYSFGPHHHELSESDTLAICTYHFRIIRAV